VSGGLLIEVAAGIHRWTLDCPDRRNALDDTLVDALLAAAERAAEDHDCRGVLLAGPRRSSAREATSPHSAVSVRTRLSRTRRAGPRSARPSEGLAPPF
jgi:1,4-dihydroxy-2-naphthoyl-CoA synthase